MGRTPLEREYRGSVVDPVPLRCAVDARGVMVVDVSELGPERGRELALAEHKGQMISKIYYSLLAGDGARWIIWRWGDGAGEEIRHELAASP